MKSQIEKKIYEMVDILYGGWFDEMLLCYNSQGFNYMNKDMAMRLYDIATDNFRETK